MFEGGDCIGGDIQASPNTSLIDGVRKFALSVTELILTSLTGSIHSAKPIAILAKSMTEERLKQVAEVIAARRVNLTLDEARDLAKRALKFKQEKGRLPSLTAQDPMGEADGGRRCLLAEKSEGRFKWLTASTMMIWNC